MKDFGTYLSPFTYRYSSNEMRQLWSEKNKALIGRKIWLAAAKIQMEAGITTKKQYADLLFHINDIDIEIILKRELDNSDPNFSGHDVVAQISDFKDKALIGGFAIHKGFTSDDILSNQEIILIKQSTAIIERRLKFVLKNFAKKIAKYKNLVCLGYTHLQVGEPTTLGYRFARYAQDFLMDLRLLKNLKKELRGKGIKGAVGTSASFSLLLKETKMTPEEHEEKIIKILGVNPVTISGQTYPRKITLQTIFTLSSIGQSAHQFASDVKLLQSSAFDEVLEPMEENQVGSSAMPHKRNPKTAEKIKSLARSLIGKVVEAWINASEVTLERGLEDSAGKRSYLAESFLIVDEILINIAQVIDGLQINTNSIKRNFEKFAPFIATEIILSEASKKGADRHKIHEILRKHCLDAKEILQKNGKNNLQENIMKDKKIASYLLANEIKKIFSEAESYIGDAPKRCDDFLKKELYSAIR